MSIKETLTKTVASAKEHPIRTGTIAVIALTTGLALLAPETARTIMHAVTNEGMRIVGTIARQFINIPPYIQ